MPELPIEKPKTKSERTREARKAAGRSAPKRPKKLGDIPVLPGNHIDPDELKTPDQRSIATVNMKLAGANFHEIAEELSYATPQSAETAYVSALATMYPMSSWETLRTEAALRAEDRLRRSLAMANADYFVDANDPDRKIANTDKLRWHDQAGKDLALLVTITGAKAPARLEVSADTAELTQMVNALLTAQGSQPVLEADVFDLALLPPGQDEDIVDAIVVDVDPGSVY